MGTFVKTSFLFTTKCKPNELNAGTIYVIFSVCVIDETMIAKLKKKETSF